MWPGRWPGSASGWPGAPGPGARFHPARRGADGRASGDLLGEMYFYLSLADRVVVGGGFQPKGSHNIIEPLALERPVIVGPHIQTIEYPAVEALAAGVCLQTSADRLVADVMSWPDPAPETISRFVAAHSGAAERTLRAIAPLLRP